VDTNVLFLIATVGIALIFDLINGFHDAANSIATVVSTRVLRPQIAVLWAAAFNMAAMFIFAPRVADTLSNIINIQPNDEGFALVILSGLLGAIFWNILTWLLGLPTSSSHALIGGLSGAGLAYAGLSALHYDLILTTVAFIFISPLLGFVGGFVVMLLNYWVFRHFYPEKVDRIFRKGQLFSAALYSIGHGANDAQKTMGVILAFLVATGHLASDVKLSLFDPQTSWIIISCNLCMALGTALGGWRIVKTMGMRITHLKPMGGFSAETSGAFSLYFATLLGIPVSTTHTITASIIGVASATMPFSGIRWMIAARIVLAWILTLPGSACIGAVIFWMVQ
jgi:PiT family inorganic phosphate transporter